MTVQKFPFTISKRRTSKYYYVRFKDSKTGKYTTAISTKQTDKAEAMKTAWNWYTQGKITRQDREQTLESVTLWETMRKVNISDSDLEKMLELAKQRGILKSYVKTGARNDVDLIEYLTDFWDWEKSEYIQETLKREKSIGRTYAKNNKNYIRKYWQPFFAGKLLGNTTREELKAFLLALQKLDLSNSTKNQTWLAGAHAIRYAYQNELMERDITAGLTGFYGRAKVREILTPELVAALFSVEWNDERAYLANLLAMCTGLRSGEIRALRKKDIGQHCLYVNHSWNALEGLKTPKNGETRIVQLPFPAITEKLLELAGSNPFSSGMDAFIFYATIPNKPIEEHIFRNGLHDALEKIGMSKEDSKKYCFHAWRHFYAAYMKDRINAKLLQSQTGHKTLAMLEHYSNHKINGDDEQIIQAQIGVFGDIVKNAHTVIFDKKKLYNNVQVAYMSKAGMYEHSRQDR